MTNMDESKRRQIVGRQMVFANFEIEGSKMLAQTAVPWKSGFSVNVETANEMRSKDLLCQMDDKSEEVKFEEWASSSYQLWRLVLVTGEDEDVQQQFRRNTWSRDSKH